jgi:hypothetical protein
MPRPIRIILGIATAIGVALTWADLALVPPAFTAKTT